MTALKKQVGGDHYKSMRIQPVELFAKTRCNAFQANMWKYITRYKSKNGKQDIEKCIHYAELGKSLCCKTLLSESSLRFVSDFCIANELSKEVSEIVKLVAGNQFDGVIEKCKALIDNEFNS